jgi:hypothetical protein
MSILTLVDAAGTGAAPVSPSNPLPVGGNIIAISQIPTVSASPAYSTGDVIGQKAGGGTGAPLVFAAAVLSAGGSGLVQSITIDCKSAPSGSPAMDLILFNADPSASTFTDNVALAVNAADFDKVIGVVHISDWTNLGTPSFAQAQNLALPFTLAATSLFGVLVARSTPTLGSTSDLTISVNVIRN